MKSAACAAAFLALGIASGDAGAETVSGDKVIERTEKIFSAIPWAASLDEALLRGSKEKKLVFYVQIVGDLKGGL
jgi:hypothetical protein